MNIRMTLAALTVAATAFVGIGTNNSAEAGGCYGGYCHSPVYVNRPVYNQFDYGLYTPRVVIRCDHFGRHYFMDSYGVQRFVHCDNFGRYSFFNGRRRCYINNYSTFGF